MSELSCLLGRDGSGGMCVGIHRVDMLSDVILDTSKRPGVQRDRIKRGGKNTVRHQKLLQEMRSSHTRLTRESEMNSTLKCVASRKIID